MRSCRALWRVRSSGHFQGATGAGGVAIDEGGLMGGWLEIGGGEQYEGVFFQGADPKVLKLSGVLIEVAAVSLEAFGEAERQPVGFFVEGAGALFGGANGVATIFPLPRELENPIVRPRPKGL